MRTWIIGHTSNYSKAVADRCVGVTKFGRDNIDYASPFESFIKTQKHVPDRIFINIGIEDKISVHTDQPDEDYMEMLDKFSKTWLFKIRLYTWLYKKNIPCTICDVTSTITMWPQNHRDALSYSVMRAMGQQAARSHNTDILKIFQVSPNGITPERVNEYADKTVAWMQNPPHDVNSIVNLDDNVLVGSGQSDV